MSNQLTIIDFTDSDKSEWSVINDGVMGGLSRSGIRRTDGNTGIFAGELSLENNGGFASVRASIGRRDLSGHAGLEIRVKGDGRTYQVRLRTNNRFDGIAYRTTFDTRDDEWMTVQIPFEEFVPTFRGRIIKDAPSLDVSQIHQVGFMLADKNPGSFALEIDFVRTWGSVTIDP